MSGTRYDALVAWIFTFDRLVASYVLPMTFFFAVAVVAIAAKGRRPLELAMLLLLAWVGFIGLSILLFHFGLDRPVLRFEAVTFP